MGKLVLVSAETPLPEPPYPADTKSKGWRFELDLERLAVSDTWTLCPPDIRPWLLMLWMSSWVSVPCGSYTNDDKVISGRISMPLNLFLAHKDVLMRGWLLHADQRLYHHVITDMVLRVCNKRVSNKKRVADHRLKKNQQLGSDVMRYTAVTNVAVMTPVPEPVPVLKAKAKATALSRGSRFDLTALPTEWAQDAAKIAPGKNPGAIFDAFGDYWRGIPGQRGVKLDWRGTWRNWVRKEAQSGSRPGAAPSNPFAGARG